MYTQRSLQQNIEINQVTSNVNKIYAAKINAGIISNVEIFLNQGGVDSIKRIEINEPKTHDATVHMCSTDVLPRKASDKGYIEAGPLSAENTTNCSLLEGSNTMVRKPQENEAADKSQLVISTFNCECWKSNIMKQLIENISENHTRNIILACQETWKFDIPKLFKKELSGKYYFIHEAAMNPALPRKKRSPFWRNLFHNL